ncbi:amino acid ABC transporter permease [Miniphocaeibacter halophilus]|uniref:Amino acid ABC transporter permease n=1 Tax=Miniphocaeibacter halophilus TaxID=2931922 RepID=A0AC61MRZ9_9FIRM|nr:amino acid ABC transporter permease [Miniphocaeibacter halophilus]QQK07098.1 amino acid ABC transporter permease [Miniphocaeibacter halophilus]
MNLSIENFLALQEFIPMFLQGIKNTLLLSIIGIFFGIILGMILSLFRLSRFRILRGISLIYLEFFRCTPLMVQAFFIFFAPPELFGIKFSPFYAGAIAMSLNSAAYVSEIIRSGINSVDKGQMEASRSLGLSYGKTMRYVIIPQAVKNILPTLGNEFVAIIKETSTLTVIGAAEVMYTTDRVKASSFQTTAPIIVAMVIYFVITFTLSRVIAYFERRMKVSD